MRFAQEFWLYMVPLVPLLWLAFRAADRQGRRRLELLLGTDADHQVEGANPRLRAWQRFFFLFGVFWLLLALARPQWGANEVSVTQRGSDIVIALDISNSMLAEDVLPNRMGRAITELNSFLSRLEDSRVGLVFFAGSAFVQCPLTLDYGTAEIFLKMAGPDMMSQQGTNIASALKTSRSLLAKGRDEGVKNNFQAILLVTDGEDLEGDWEAEAKGAQSDGIKVIPVGVGDKGGGLIPAFDQHGRPDGFLKDDEGKVVMTRLDLASLEKMAGISGGSSFLIGVDGLAGDRLFAELQRLGRRDLEERRISSFKERHFWPLMMAVFCFAMRLILHSRRPNRTPGSFAASVGPHLTGILVLGLIVLAQPAAAVLRPAGGDQAAEGRQLYLAGDFESALVKFEEALIQAPEDPRISLALGETLHQLERFEEAGVEFERAFNLADGSDLKAEALYNRGTTRLAAGQAEEAVEDLMEALQLDPSQADALHNLEVALKRMQEQQEQQEQEEQQEQQDQQEQQEQEGEQEQQDQQQDQQDQQEQEGDQQEKQEEQQQENEEEPEQEQPPEDSGEQEQEPPPEPQEQESSEDEVGPDDMTKEQALQLLKALDRDEEELKKSVQKRLKGGRPKSGKKW